MDYSAILKMVEDAFYNRFFIICVIVRNNDIKIQAVIKHPYKGAQGQGPKSSKGKQDEEIPEPSFLADPSHFVNVADKHIFSIVNESKVQQCGFTKKDALRLKKYWDYLIKIIGKNN